MFPCDVLYTFAGAARPTTVRGDAFMVAAILLCVEVRRGSKVQQDARRQRLPTVCDSRKDLVLADSEEICVGHWV